MSFTTSLLYLLLLYAVLDKDGNLSLNKGLLIAGGILLLKCHLGNRCGGAVRSGDTFHTINGI